MNKLDARKRRGRKTKERIKRENKHRLVVFRSANHISSQIVVANEKGDKVLAASSTMEKKLKTKLKGKTKVEQAALVGQSLGEKAAKCGITQLAFDRSGYKYHGRVKALAEGAREAGLNF